MKITLLQRDILWGDAEGNALRLEEALSKQAGADLYVLPEMWSTGFVTDPAPYAEDAPGAALDCMKSLSAKTGAAIAGSVAVRENGEFRNRFYFVKPDGSVLHYDKHHLFTYGGEHRRYTAGNEKVIVEWRGVRFRLIVCYDLRFPAWCRNSGDYDVLLCVASWPDVRTEAWKALLKARAIENQSYVVAVNRVGNDPSNHYTGASMALDAWGREVAACTEGEECSSTVELDMNALEAFRKSFPVLEDRDC